MVAMTEGCPDKGSTSIPLGMYTYLQEELRRNWPLLMHEGWLIWWKDCYPRWTAEKKAIASLERDGFQCSQPMATVLTSQRAA